ncbi:MAG TPA: hypothetical protein VHR97_10200 [Candidatus Baltobacteraceae bacterium]|jgi:hypothetical protein|nr:hypothetical protein [Candidatus Baltobacteraceae bacterium]
MVRRAAAAVALLVAAWLAAPAPLRAQSLQRLTVESFVLSADTTAPQVDTPFHLIVTLHVRENVMRIDNLDLPLLAELELLGDERETQSGSRGTQYRETITVVAHHAGVVAIAPATLQAVDARDGKPKQWYTNQLRLQVAGPPLIVTGATALRGTLHVLLRILLWVVGIAIVVGLVLLIARRRPKPLPMPVPVAPPPPAPVVAERSRRQEIDDALTVLRAEGTRVAAVRVRTAVWRMVGASEGETLADVLRRPQTNDPVLRGLLIALERSAFTYDEDLRAAVDDACAALSRYAETLP